ncbi:extensin-like [Arachis duranensis]|uniref:Extensin-like n=1 Tax=Arachis duranensis TaxID=130453 RepID=A0A6P4CQ24_ARADU|nr:extensin-like [Arachis duranensis]
MENAKPMGTPMHPNSRLDKDETEKDVDETMYKSMRQFWAGYESFLQDSVIWACFKSRAPREKIYKLPTKPSTRSQDRTFTPSPSPSPPTSPPHCDPMARTKNTPRFPASAKPTPPPKATPSKPASSKPGSSKPSSSKGKRQAMEEPVPEPQQPRARSVPVRLQRGNTRVPLKNVKEP